MVRIQQDKNGNDLLLLGKILQKLWSGSWDQVMREGGAQKMLNEYCTVLNQYFDRECE